MATYEDADEYVYEFARDQEGDIYKCEDCEHESAFDLAFDEVTWYEADRRSYWFGEVRFLCPSCDTKNIRKYGEERY